MKQKDYDAFDAWFYRTHPPLCGMADNPTKQELSRLRREKEVGEVATRTLAEYEAREAQKMEARAGYALGYFHAQQEVQK